MIQTLIIEDEINAQKTLIQMLSLYYPSVNVLATTGKVSEALALIELHRPQLIFLDIQLEDGNGFELLKKIEEINFEIIFITAFNQYAIKAFKFSALDYLLKPIDPDLLIEALEKVEKVIQQKNIQQQIQTFLNNQQQPSEKQKIVLKNSENIFIIEVQEINRLESEGPYTTFFLEDGRSILISKNLKFYEDLLSTHHFFRVHQSHMINLKKLSRLERKEGGYLIMKDESIVPVSVRKKEALINAIEQLG